MAKSFKKATESAQDMYDSIVKGTKDTENSKDTKDSKATADAKEYYRFNLKITLEYKDYLQAAAYRESSPTKIVTITEYICKLIADDMERNNG